MKTQVMALLLIVVNPIEGVSQTTIDTNIKDEITAILKNPKSVYELDFQQNKMVFDRMDKWFEKYFDFSKASLKEDKSGLSKYKLLYNENQPIFVGGGKIEGLTSPKPFYIWYDKGLQRRSFKKEIAVPGKQVLDDKAIINIAGRFVAGNEFYTVTDLDSLTDPSVVSLRRDELGPDGKVAVKSTILHRVEFKRRLVGLEVVNSRQIVEIHPASQELLGYKSIDWTPVNEKSGRPYPYLTLQEIVTQIDSLLARSHAKYAITKVKAGMFQDAKLVFPVLTVYVEFPQSENVKSAYKQTLTISLVKNVASVVKPKSLKYKPENTKE